MKSKNPRASTEPRMRDDTMAVVNGTWTGTEWPCARRHFSASVGIKSSERRISYHSLSDLRRLSECYKDLQDRITKVHPHYPNF